MNSPTSDSPSRRRPASIDSPVLPPHEPERRAAGVGEPGPELVIAVDDELRVVAVNDALLGWLGRNEDETVGQPLGRLFDGNRDAIALTAYAALQAGRPIVRRELLAAAPDAPAQRFEIGFLPLRPGGRLALVCTLRETREASAVEAAAIESANRERLRLGRDLHDTLGQELATTSMLLSSLEKRMGDAAPELRASSTEIRAALTQALDSLRGIVRGLAPPGLEDGGLSRALEQLARRAARDSGLRVEFSGPDHLPPLPAGTAEHVYRFAQEALANVVRHARATAVEIRLAVEASALTLGVSDDGGGFDADAAAARNGMGLRIMRYRAEQLGGRCDVESTPQGTRVRLRVPLSAHVPRPR